MKRLIIIAALAISVTGCATRRAPPPPLLARPTFPIAEYEALPKTGSGAVTGQAFLKTRGGDVKTGAGNKIYLYPVTSYLLWDEANSRSKKTSIDSRFYEFRRETIADASGRFTFKNVPNGDYKLTGEVTWQVPQVTKYSSYMSTQGGWITKMITVANGETTEIMLTE